MSDIIVEDEVDVLEEVTEEIQKRKEEWKKN